MSFPGQPATDAGTHRQSRRAPTLGCSFQPLPSRRTLHRSGRRTDEGEHNLESDANRQFVFFYLNALIWKRRVLLTVPGLRRLYCTTPDASTLALTQASEMWWHSSGTLRMSGCTRPQLNTNTEANINISPQLQLMSQGMQVQTSRFLTPAVF